MGMAPSTDSGIVAEMDARSKPGLKDPFEEAIDDALSFLPADLRAAMSNVEIVVEDEPPDGRPLLGLYRGVPLPGGPSPPPADPRAPSLTAYP
jgi:predicted Zn-dependent protease with MMP-like domain